MQFVVLVLRTRFHRSPWTLEILRAKTKKNRQSGIRILHTEVSQRKLLVPWRQYLESGSSHYVGSRIVRSFYFTLCIHCQYFSCFKLRLTTFIKRILIDWLIDRSGAKPRYRAETYLVQKSALVNAMVTTTIRLRFDGRSTVYQRSLRSQWRNPLAA